jgi:hypothetical protein
MRLPGCVCCIPVDRSARPWWMPPERPERRWIAAMTVVGYACTGITAAQPRIGGTWAGGDRVLSSPLRCRSVL